MPRANKYENVERKTYVTLVLTTYGTEEGLEKTLLHMKKELELQGFNVDFVID